MICMDGMGLGSGEAPFFEKKTGKKTIIELSQICNKF